MELPCVCSGVKTAISALMMCNISFPDIELNSRLLFESIDVYWILKRYMRMEIFFSRAMRMRGEVSLRAPVTAVANRGRPLAAYQRLFMPLPANPDMKLSPI